LPTPRRASGFPTSDACGSSTRRWPGAHACFRTRGGRSRAAGYTGLSGALLAAGAGGTVGSTWDVDDRSTAALMAAFHDGYRQSRDGATALRNAQLTLLRSRNTALRTPAAWAGFRYAGD